MFELKLFREKLYGELSSESFARLMGMEVDRLNLIENNKGQITTEELSQISKVSGISIIDLLDMNLSVDRVDAWEDTKDIKTYLVEYMDRGINANIYDYERLENLKSVVEKSLRKPRIAIIGHSDVGKSHMINSIIGEDLLPVDWTPMTSIINYVMHVSDRPKFMKEDVWIFRKFDNEIWDSLKLNDEKYCKERLLVKGDYDLLDDYGVRVDDEVDDCEATSAVTFVDSDFLKNAVIMDVPGYGTGDRDADDLMTIEAKGHADILIYLSLSNAFMRGDEIEYLKESIHTLSVIENKKNNDLDPLCNLFIVASQAHVINDQDATKVKCVLDKGAKRVLKTFPQTYWNERESITGYKYDDDVFRNRFFSYTTDVDHLKLRFMNELNGLLGRLSQVIKEQGLSFIYNTVKSELHWVNEDVKSSIHLIENQEASKKRLNQLLMDEPMRNEEHQALVNKVLLGIEQHKFKSVSEFTYKYYKTLSEDHIVSVIKKKGFTKVKEDTNYLTSYLNSELQSGMQRICKNEAMVLKKTIDQFLDDFDAKTVGKIDASNDLNFDVGFDTQAVFAGSLAGLATFGGLAVWASSLGNLGAYILVAKGVSVLSAVGISIAGGTASATAAVAAIGGPVTLGIGIALLAMFAVFGIASGSWEQRLAAEIIKANDKQDVLNQYKTVINNFWEDAREAFEVSAKELDDAWYKKIKDLKNLLDNEDIKSLDKRIKLGQEYKNFLEKIEWKV